MPKPNPRICHYIIFCFLVGVLKLLLVANNEIIAEPYDASMYINQAADLWRSPSYSGFGYSLWLWVGHFSGVPQRIIIEIAWLLSAGLSASLLSDSLHAKKLQPCLFTLLAFAPQTIFLFDHALTESLYIVLTLLGVTFSCRTIVSDTGDQVKCAAIGSLIFGYMLTMRNEGAVVIAFIMTVVLLVFIMTRNIRRAILIVSVFLVGTAIPSLTLMAYNYAANGVFTKGVVDMKSHMHLLQLLAKIDTGESPIRKIPITTKARSLAYRTSPKLATFEHKVEAYDSAYRRATKASLGIENEIGAGWIWHAYTWIALDESHGKMKLINRRFEEINQELETAFHNNALTEKEILHPLIAGDLAMILPALPKSFIEVARLTAYSVGPTQDQQINTENFDDLLQRRRTLSPSYSVYISGWAVVLPEDSKITQIEISADNEPSYSKITWFDRSDIRDYFRISNPRTGFTIAKPLSAHTTFQLNFLINNTNYRSTTNLHNGITYELPIKDNGKILFAIDQIEEKGPDPFRTEVKTKLLKASPVLVAASCALSILLSLYIFITQRSTTRGKHILAIACACFSWLFIRTSFYVLIDAGAWATEIRYLQSSSIILLLLAPILAYSALTRPNQLHEKI